MAAAKWKKAVFGLVVLLATVGIILGILSKTNPSIYGGSDKSASSSGSPAVATASVGDSAPATTTPAKTTTTPAKATTPAQSSAPKADAKLPVPSPAGAGNVVDISGNNHGDMMIHGSNNAAGSADDTVMKTVNDAIAGNRTQGIVLPANFANKQTFVDGLIRDSTTGSLTAGGVCMPRDGPALVAAMANPDCTILQLGRGTYDIGTKEIPVTSTKVLVGNPIPGLGPTIDGSKAPRIFHVMSGGYLALRFMELHRGGGEMIGGIPVLRGGSLLVEPGAVANLLMVTLTMTRATNPDILIGRDLSRATRIFGGQIFVAGGTVIMTACSTYNFIPGVLLRELYVVGIEICVAGGALYTTGVNFVSAMLFLNVAGLALFVAHLGGIWIATGGNFSLNVGVIHCSGAGLFVFHGGGISVWTGINFAGAFGAIATFGAGVQFFVGGGVVITTSCTHVISSGVSAFAGVGALTAIGGGVVVRTGGNQAFVTGASFLAGAGIANFMGGGTMTVTGSPLGANFGVASIYGSGLSYYLGSGDAVLTGCTTALTSGTLSLYLIGIYFLGYGVMVSIGNDVQIDLGAAFISPYGGGAIFFVGVGLLVYRASGPNPHIGIGGTFLTVPMVGAGAVVRRRLQEKLEERARMLLEGEGMPYFSPELRAALFSAGASDKEAGNSGLIIIKDGETAIRKAGSTVAPFQLNSGSGTCEVCGSYPSTEALASDFGGDGAETCTNSYGKSTCSLATAVGPDGKPLSTYLQTVAKLADPSASGTAPEGLTSLVHSSLITSTYKVGCTGTEASNSKCMSASDLKSAVTKGFNDDCAAIEVSPKVDMGPLAAMAGVSNATPLDEVLPNSDITGIFDVIFVTHDKKCADKARNFLALQKDLPAEQLTAVLNDHVATPTKDLFIDDAKVVPSLSHEQPALNSKSANAQVLESVIDTSQQQAVLVPQVFVAPQDATASTTRLAMPSFAKGESASVALLNFVDGKNIKLALTKDCNATSADDIPLLTTKYAQASSDNHVMKLNVPLTNAQAGETYAIAARQVDSIAWCSQPFTIKA